MSLKHLFLLSVFAALSLSGGELLQLECTIPVSVPAWTKSICSGTMPANWQAETKRDTEFSCSQIQENGRKAFVCNLKRGVVYFIIPAPEIRTAEPAEFYIEMERPAEMNNETILSVKGGADPGVWSGAFLEGINLEYKPGVQRWASTVNAPDWRKCSQYWLLLELSDPGVYKIYSVGTRKLPEGKPYYPVRPVAKGTKNLFSSSRCPLGLPSGWSTGAVYQNALRVSEEPGPSGFPHLILESDAPGTPLNTEPFNPEDFGKINYVSFSYRAKGVWEARVFTREGSSFRMENVKLPPSGEWRRIMLAYKPCENARGHVLQIRGSGVFELDAVRANDTPDPSYVPQNETEIALAVPEERDAAYSRILFSDEPAEIRYLLTGDTEGCSIRFAAVNLYGERFELGRTDRTSGLLNFSAALEKRPFGQFRIEAVAERDGRIVSPVNELVVTRIARPLYWGVDAPRSYFGALATLDRSLLSFKAAGVNHVRFHDHGGLQFVGWAYVEPEEGKWKFFDEEIARYRKHNLWILGELGTTPYWAGNAAKFAKWKNFYRTRWLIPADLSRFANYVSTVLDHYRGSIRDWGVGNEPWGGFFLDMNGKGEFVRIHQNARFAEYQRVAYEAAKKADPSVTVAGINATIRNAGWARELYRRGANQFCDVVEQHLYSSAWNGFPGDAFERGTRAALGPVKWEKPVWNTEGDSGVSGNLAAPSEPQIGLYKNSIPWINRFDYVANSDRLARYLVANLANGMKRIYLYSGERGQYTALIKPGENLVLDQPDAFPQPQLAAHSALAIRIDGRRFRERFALAEGIWCCLFESESGSCAVIVPKRFSKPVNVTCAVTGATASDLFGNPLEFPVNTGDTLRYVEAPVSAEALKAALKVE